MYEGLLSRWNGTSRVPEEPEPPEPEEPPEPVPGDIGTTVLARWGGQEHVATVVGEVRALVVEIHDSKRTEVLVGPGDWREPT